MAVGAAKVTTLKQASDLDPGAAGRGADRLLPVMPELADLFVDGRLRRGTTVSIAPGRGATTLLLAMLAGVSRAGSWCAAVGMPQLG